MKLKVKTIEPKKEGQKPLHFKSGGLHESTHTPIGEKISPSKRVKALAGGFGAKAKKQALFASNVFHH